MGGAGGGHLPFPKSTKKNLGVFFLNSKVLQIFDAEIKRKTKVLLLLDKIIIICIVFSILPPLNFIFSPNKNQKPFLFKRDLQKRVAKK